MRVKLNGGVAARLCMGRLRRGYAARSKCAPSGIGADLGKFGLALEGNRGRFYAVL